MFVEEYGLVSLQMRGLKKVITHGRPHRVGGIRFYPPPKTEIIQFADDGLKISSACHRRQSQPISHFHLPLPLAPQLFCLFQISTGSISLSAAATCAATTNRIHGRAQFLVCFVPIRLTPTPTRYRFVPILRGRCNRTSAYSSIDYGRFPARRSAFPSLSAGVPAIVSG